MSHVRNVFILILLGLVPSGIWAQQHRLPFPSNIKDSSFTKFKNVVTSQVESKNERDLAQLVVSLLGILMSSSFPTAVAEGIGESCKANSIEYVDNIRNFTLWALQSKCLRFNTFIFILSKFIQHEYNVHLCFPNPSKIILLTVKS